MKNKITQKGKSIILALTIVLQLAVAPNTASAQTDISINTSCFTEWDTFISSTISITDFKEYWKDIFKRYNQNTCYYADINTLLKQIDKTRSQLRTAILGCKDQQVKPLKAKYYELEIELKYLRNFVSFADKKGTLISEEKVYKELKKKYVDEDFMFTEEAFKKLFDKYKTKYKSRLSSTYSKCQDVSIKKLVDRWNKLVQTVKGIQADAKSIKEDFDKAINTPPTGMRGFIGDIKTFRLESIAPIKTPTEILNEKTKETGAEPTIDQLQVSISETSQKYSEQIQQTSLTAEYEALYKNGGDAIAISYEKILIDLNKVIEDSYKPLEDLKQCAKKSADRQCQ
ncbi:hypothetical protein C0416_04305 [bacterium]|nr:hypothetical protein [bacterium]